MLSWPYYETMATLGITMDSLDSAPPYEFALKARCSSSVDASFEGHSGHGHSAMGDATNISDISPGYICATLFSCLTMPLARLLNCVAFGGG